MAVVRHHVSKVENARASHTVVTSGRSGHKLLEIHVGEAEHDRKGATEGVLRADRSREHRLPHRLQRLLVRLQDGVLTTKDEREQALSHENVELDDADYLRQEDNKCVYNSVILALCLGLHVESVMDIQWKTCCANRLNGIVG
eukprot:UN2380